MDKDNNHSQKTRTTSYALIAIVAALALFGVVAITAITIPMQQQQAEARGCPADSPAANASKTRCFHGA